MNKIWYYIIAPIVSVVVGVFLVMVYDAIVNFFKIRRLKKNIPTDSKLLADPGKTNITDIKEVENDERRRSDKFREFERLKFLAERERGNEGQIASLTEDKRQSTRIDIPNEPIVNTRRDESPNREIIKFD